MPPPPPPAVDKTSPELMLRLDYALANRALRDMCNSMSASPWSMWAEVIPRAELALHGVGVVSEHLPLQVAIGHGMPAGVNVQSVLDAVSDQRVVAAAIGSSDEPEVLPSLKVRSL